MDNISENMYFLLFTYAVSRSSSRIRFKNDIFVSYPIVPFEVNLPKVLWFYPKRNRIAHSFFFGLFNTYSKSICVVVFYQAFLICRRLPLEWSQKHVATSKI